jgi:hypothetical protein
MLRGEVKERSEQNIIETATSSLEAEGGGEGREESRGESIRGLPSADATTAGYIQAN